MPFLLRLFVVSGLLLTWAFCMKSFLGLLFACVSVVMYFDYGDSMLAWMSLGFFSAVLGQIILFVEFFRHQGRKKFMATRYYVVGIVATLVWLAFGGLLAYGVFTSDIGLLKYLYHYYFIIGLIVVVDLPTLFLGIFMTRLTYREIAARVWALEDAREASGSEEPA